MRKYIVVGLLVGIFLIVPYFAFGSVLKMTIGASQVYLLWQTPPSTFYNSAFWGEVGLELTYESISARVNYFEILPSAQQSAVTFGAKIAMFKISSSRFFLGTDFIIRPDDSLIAAIPFTEFGWSPSPFVYFYTSIGVHKMLLASTYQVTSVNWEMGIKVSLTLSRG